MLPIPFAALRAMKENATASAKARAQRGGETGKHWSIPAPFAPAPCWPPGRCARTNTAELGAAPLERADVPAGARKRWEAYLQQYASHRCECRCPKMPLHDDAFPRPPLSMAGSTKSSVSVRGGIWKRTLHCETPGRFFRHYGPNAPSGLPFGTKQKNICMQRNRTSALAMLGG